MPPPFPRFLLPVLFSFALAGAALTLPQSGGGHPSPPLAPPENPVTPEKAVLGKILFWDEQLSSDDTVACGTCHRPEAGFADPRIAVDFGADGLPDTGDEKWVSPGVVRAASTGEFEPDERWGLDPQLGTRRSPSIFTALYTRESMWDGGVDGVFRDPKTGEVLIPAGATLENQVLGPPVDDVEMAHEQRDWSDVVEKLQRVRPLALATDLPTDVSGALASAADYPDLFELAFGDEEITAARIAFAIATYERTLNPDESPYAVYKSGLPAALTGNQVAGMNQFNGLAGCHVCHQPPTFTDGLYHNLGLRPVSEDPGRAAITGDPADQGAFRTPSLLSAGLRPRYFHTGQFGKLFPDGVSSIYLNGGGPFRGNLDGLLTELDRMPGVDLAKVMDFVGNALTDPRMVQGEHPFDRPTLRSERESLGANVYGRGTESSDGVMPRIVAHVPAVEGSGSFKIGIEGAPTDRVALLMISDKPDFAGTPSAGITLHLRPPFLATFPVTVPTGSDHATVVFDLPFLAGARGRTLYAQWRIQDPLARSGAAATPAASFTVY